MLTYFQLQYAIMRRNNDGTEDVMRFTEEADPKWVREARAQRLREREAKPNS